MTYETKIETICKGLCKEYFWGELAGQGIYNASLDEQFNYVDKNWERFSSQAMYLLGKIET
ncbi:MAG TPA: hypothetical protein VIY47_10085 [Ignavibacteriaceae bacterium]